MSSHNQERIYIKVALVAFMALLLSACWGGSSEKVSSSSESGSVRGQSVETFFAQNVQPKLGLCRTCHVEGGVADTAKGRRFLLSGNPDEDYQAVRKAWKALGQGVTRNRLLTKASNTASEPHSGGAPWEKGEPAYNAMKTVLECWSDPSSCSVDAGQDQNETDKSALLSASHGTHRWFEYCAERPDSAELPADPRTLVNKQINQEKSVHFNFPWKTCTQYDDDQYPDTCGELRKEVAQGETMMKGHGQKGQNIFFGGNHGDGLWTITAEEYNNLWKGWGLSERPDNYDQLVAQRYGLTIDDNVRNPYPLPGEDPQQAKGGNGQLPNALTQVRGTNGQWTGEIGFKCHVCHTDKVKADGVGTMYGSGNNASDFDLFLDEVMAQVPRPIPGVARALPFTFNKTRGVSNALQPQIISFLTPDDLGQTLLTNPVENLIFALEFYGNSPNTGEINPPAWWNLAFKPSKFFNGLLAGDNLRSGPAFDYPIARPPFMWADIQGAKEWVKKNSMEPELWFMSLESPEYPGSIDKELARQGAILFHTKDLWATSKNPDIPRPKGNGSCAGCHGVYSERFAEKSEYLATPELKGTAGYIVPLDIIETDRRYAESITDEQADTISQNIFAAYDDSYNENPDCTIQTRDDLSNRDQGYLAPPLHGIWATGPYLHNGSVPTVWGLLKPSARPDVWERVSAPLPEGLDENKKDKLVMGFDRNFERAYDQARMGWQYNVIDCQNRAGCRNDGPTEAQKAESRIAENSGLLYNFTTKPSKFMTKSEIEKRKIFNTWEYGRSNEGHAFTKALTDQERKAIIEYLKTL